MGLQTGTNEIKRTLEILSDVLEGTTVKERDIKGLDDGWFWVLTKRSIKKAYAKPWFMDEALAVRVAKHELPSTKAWDIALDAWKRSKIAAAAPAEGMSEEMVRRIVRETVSDEFVEEVLNSPSWKQIIANLTPPNVRDAVREILREATTWKEIVSNLPPELHAGAALEADMEALAKKLDGIQGTAHEALDRISKFEGRLLNVAAKLETALKEKPPPASGSRELVVEQSLPHAVLEQHRKQVRISDKNWLGRLVTIYADNKFQPPGLIGTDVEHEVTAIFDVAGVKAMGARVNEALRVMVDEGFLERRPDEKGLLRYMNRLPPAEAVERKLVLKEE